MSKAAILALILFFAIASQASAAEIPTTAIPHKLQLYIGGFLGPSYYVELLKDGLHYEMSVGGKVKEKFLIHPTQPSWKKFLARMKKVKLEKWASEYPNDHGVMDGTRWKITLAIGKLTISSQGNNNYPKDGDVSQPSDNSNSSKVFNEFCQAVSDLTGKPFR